MNTSASPPDVQKLPRTKLRHRLPTSATSLLLLASSNRLRKRSARPRSGRDELQTRTDRLLQRVNHQLKAAEARADAAEQRAEHAEELLFSLHDLIKPEFGRIDVVAV